LTGPASGHALHRGTATPGAFTMALQYWNLRVSGHQTYIDLTVIAMDIYRFLTAIYQS
jgi:hypothetical protein